MHRKHPLNCFQFNYHGVFNQKINLISGFYFHSLIKNRERKLRLHLQPTFS